MPVCSEVENSGIRVAVGDCSVTERRRWRPPYQTGTTVHVHAKLQAQRGRTHGAECAPSGSVPLSQLGNVVTKIGLQQQQHHVKCSFPIPAIYDGQLTFDLTKERFWNWLTTTTILGVHVKCSFPIPAIYDGHLTFDVTNERFVAVCNSIISDRPTALN